MQAVRYGMLAVVVLLGGFSSAKSMDGAESPSASESERFIGAWHLVSIRGAAEDGAPDHTSDIKGTLIYTRDGHMSVQIMYPPSAATLSNDYVLNGYEASFGRYDVNEAAHTVTHHVEGSITRGLVGKDLARVYQFSGGHLIIKSVNPAEHWSVTWEHD